MFAVWTLQSQGSARARPATWAVSAGLGVGVGVGRGADARVRTCTRTCSPPSSRPVPQRFPGLFAPSWVRLAALAAGRGCWCLVWGGRRPAALFLESAASREGRGQSGARSPADPGDSAEG